MRPYGTNVIESPDVADINAMGAKRSTGKFPGRSGDYHPYASGASKARTRRAQKRRARREGDERASER